MSGMIDDDAKFFELRKEGKVGSTGQGNMMDFMML